MTQAITSWETEVMPYVRNVPWPAFLNAVRDAAITFCEETSLWVDTLDRISVDADTAEYALTDPDNAEIYGTDEVKYKADGAEDSQFKTLHPMSENQEDLHRRGSWKFQTGTSPSHFMLDADKTLILWRIPTLASTEGLLVKVILRPDKICTVLPDVLYTDHYKTIGRGARAGLFGQSAQPWYNDEAEGKNMAEFNTDIANAKMRKIDRGTKRKMAVRMREWI